MCARKPNFTCSIPMCAAFLDAKELSRLPNERDALRGVLARHDHMANIEGEAKVGPVDLVCKEERRSRGWDREEARILVGWLELERNA